jgi:hypothetical protein
VRAGVCVLWELILWELSWELPLKMGSKWGILVLFSEIIFELKDMKNVLDA